MDFDYPIIFKVLYNNETQNHNNKNFQFNNDLNIIVCKDKLLIQDDINNFIYKKINYIDIIKWGHT